MLSVTRQTSLPSAREKTLGKEGFVDALCVEPSLLSATLGKGLAECFCGFAECFVLRALGKACESGSESLRPILRASIGRRIHNDLFFDDWLVYINVKEIISSNTSEQ